MVARADTETVYVYGPGSQQNTTVREDPFDVTILANYPQPVLAFTLAAFYQTMLVNSQVCTPVLKPQNCPIYNQTLSPCSEYICPGVGTAPNLAAYLDANALTENWDSIQVPQLPGITIDFWAPYIIDNTLDGVDSSDFQCALFGTSNAAAELCLGDSALIEPHMVAGIPYQ
jgi:hypothetical protein